MIIILCNIGRFLLIKSVPYSDNYERTFKINNIIIPENYTLNGIRFHLFMYCPWEDCETSKNNIRITISDANSADIIFEQNYNYTNINRNAVFWHENNNTANLVIVRIPI